YQAYLIHSLPQEVDRDCLPLKAVNEALAREKRTILKRLPPTMDCSQARAFRSGFFGSSGK
ncbi:MAG: hypothetical protein WBL82_09405, partial [Terriglobales bacterium]